MSSSAACMDPVKFCNEFWPEVKLYDKQKEILYSVRDNDETYVPAGNALGKDFVSAFCVLWWFVSRRPSRVVTTSVKHDQLNDVLWGEIRRFINTSRYKLPIQYNHMKIRQTYTDGRFVELSEIAGQVVNQGESLLGRHLPRDMPRTLVVFDEASGMKDDVYESTDTWAHHKLIIGNPYPCTNFCFKGVKGGDLPRPDGNGFYRKVIKITADDSPNVRLAKAEISKGKEPSNQTLIPGVIDYPTYTKRRALWDKIRQCIGLDAEFYEGAEVLLYPPEWLNLAEERARQLKGQTRYAKAIGVDPAEGGDKTAWSIVDHLGLIKQISLKTPDTSVITAKTLALMQQYNVPAEGVAFDQGGGGKQHADRMRQDGHNVRTVAFGGTVFAVDRFRKRMRSTAEKKEIDEERYAYKNRRAEMFGLLRLRLDPDINDEVFALPEEYEELRRQLSPIPLKYDPEGRLMLPPKNKKSKDSKEVTLVDLIGHSPDEADSLVLAVFAMTHEDASSRIGVAF